MAEKQRFSLEDAYRVAVSLVKLLEPACAKIVIAGSIRREKPAVGDIELLCVPKPSDSLFRDALDEAIRIPHPFLLPRPSVKKTFTYGDLNKLMYHVESGIPVDIFSTTPDHWGMALMLRTGSAEFNIRFMARLKQLGFAGHAYPWNGKGKRHGSISTPNGEIDCPTEEDVFHVLGWKYIEPRARI